MSRSIATSYPGWLYSLPASLVSLLAAIGISASILLYPGYVVTAEGEVEHGVLTLLMWGLAAGFVHGVGFIPENRALRHALGPVAAWILMGGLSMYFLVL